MIGVFAQPPGEWYAKLNKPTWTPPPWVFGPIWTILYALMATALFLVVRKGTSSPGVVLALCVFAAQLALNTAWSPVFFGLHQIGLALVVIVLMWLMIVMTIGVFWSVSDLAAMLLVPYLVWVTIATALNASIWMQNS